MCIEATEKLAGVSSFIKPYRFQKSNQLLDLMASAITYWTILQAPIFFMFITYIFSISITGSLKYLQEQK